MHVHTVRTRFTFGDRVRYSSTHYREGGIGTVFAICFDASGYIDYLVTPDGRDGELLGGVAEDEMTLLTDHST